MWQKTDNQVKMQKTTVQLIEIAESCLATKQLLPNFNLQMQDCFKQTANTWI